MNGANASSERLQYILIVSGEEILSGNRRDSHVHFITKNLHPLGLYCEGCFITGDQKDRLTDLVKTALERDSIVIVTGGLGPTVDDITRESIADATGITLYENQDALEMVKARFQSFRKTMTENNRQQALVPEHGGFFYNPNGTAPGLYFEKGSSSIIALPGPPRELEPMLTEKLIPYLMGRYSTKKDLLSVSFHLCCIGESNVDHALRQITGPDSGLNISLLSQPGCIDLTLSLNGDDEQTRNTLNRYTDAVREKFGSYIFSERHETLSETVGRFLVESKQTVAVAESCTGGLLGSHLTSVSGSSSYFLGGVIAYQNEIKVDFLGVRRETLNACGAVSRETVCEIAEGVRQRFSSDWGIAITGIAGPEGGTKEKPVGTVWIAVCSPEDKTYPFLITFPGSREAVRLRSSIYAQDQLRRLLLGLSPH